MKTVIKMAREARLCADGPTLEALERFAALVREDEREKQQEPVAYLKLNDDGVYEEDITGFPVYTTPLTAALAARQMRDAAAKVCKNFAERDMHPAECAGAIEQLPVPEVQWRDLTDEEIQECWHGTTKEGWIGFVRAVIAKFKEKQIGTA